MLLWHTNEPGGQRSNNQLRCTRRLARVHPTLHHHLNIYTQIDLTPTSVVDIVVKIMVELIHARPGD